MLRRYFTIVGIIILGLAALGVWLKPPLEKMREGVQEGLAAYAAKNTAAGQPMPAVTHVASHDWLVVVSHQAKVGDKDFFCVGAFKVTYCQSPDE